MPVEAAPLVASDVADVHDSLPAVLGPPDVARRVGDAWAALKGVRAVDGMRQRIHSLERVRSPVREAAGRMRLAKEGDLALVASWIGEFVRTTGLYAMHDPEARAERLVAARFLALWVDREPVSMAAFPRAHPQHGARRLRLHPGRAPPPRLRKRTGRACEPSHPRFGVSPVRPLHRPRQPDLQPHLPGDRVPSRPGCDGRELPGNVMRLAPTSASPHDIITVSC